MAKNQRLYLVLVPPPRRTHNRKLRLIVLLALIHYIFPRKAYAYLDLGTGSYILQLIIASLFGVSLIIKIYWGKIKTFFANISKKTKR